MNTNNLSNTKQEILLYISNHCFSREITPEDVCSQFNLFTKGEIYQMINELVDKKYLLQGLGKDYKAIIMINE
jgi:hypothetical protein